MKNRSDELNLSVIEQRLTRIEGKIELKLTRFWPFDLKGILWKKERKLPVEVGFWHFEIISGTPLISGTLQ